MKEIFKDVIGYNGNYKVSNTGKIISTERITIFCNKYKSQCKRYDKHIFMQPSKSHQYESIRLQIFGVKKMHMVHRLVASHFIPNHENKPFVNHKDGNKKNNNVDNLEWCTASENMKHAWKTGLRKNMAREKYINNLVKFSYVQCTCTGKVYNTTEAAKFISVTNSTLLRMVYGTRKNWSNFISYERRNLE
jgi:hypothetical protein